jgi:methylenetetrahydrofolate--tRNA-(uracil-5-)-methyltransferase
MLHGASPIVPPPHSMLGALYRYMREAEPKHFQPMNANFGLLDELDTPVRDKQRKREQYAARALDSLQEWTTEHGITPVWQHAPETVANTAATTAAR